MGRDFPRKNNMPFGSVVGDSVSANIGAYKCECVGVDGRCNSSSNIASPCACWLATSAPSDLVAPIMSSGCFARSIYSHLPIFLQSFPSSYQVADDGVADWSSVRLVAAFHDGGNSWYCFCGGVVFRVHPKS